MRRWQEAALVAAGSLFFSLLAIEVWRLSLSVPFEHSGDALLNQMFVKSILEHGWVLTNPDLGAPFEARQFDASFNDILNFLAIKATGIVFDDSAVVLNLYWLLSAPVIAVVAWAVLRSLGVSRWPAIVCGLLFSLLPYHFGHAELHAFLSAYWQIPLGCYLILRALLGEPLFARRADGSGGRLSGLLSRRSLGTVAICVVIGISGVYYALFTFLLLGGAAIVGLAGRWRETTVPALAAAALVLGGLVLSASPTLLYEAEHGSNPEVIDRIPEETEAYSLSLTQMLLPASNHRVAVLAGEKEDFARSTLIPSEGSQSLGLVASIGLLWLLFVLAATALGRSMWAVRPLERAAAVAAGMAFLLGTFGGVSSLIAYGVTAQFRTWNRISPFIAFFALLAVALLLERAIARMRETRWSFAGPAVLLAAVTAVAVYDQTPQVRSLAEDPAPLQASYESDERFVAELERTLPAQASVYQLPYLEFPEASNATNDVADYEPFRGYLHSRDLSWSYGAMKNRAADLGACLEDFSNRRLLPILLAMGFDAIWVDRQALEPATAQRLEQSLAALSGQEPLVSDDRRFAAYRIDGLDLPAGMSARIEAALPPTRIGWRTAKPCAAISRRRCKWGRATAGSRRPPPANLSSARCRSQLPSPGHRPRASPRSRADR